MKMFMFFKGKTAFYNSWIPCIKKTIETMLKLQNKSLQKQML